MLDPASVPSSVAAETAADTLTRNERQLRFFLFLFLASFVGETLMYAIEVFAGHPEARGYIVNSIAKDMLFAALAVVAIADLRRRMRLVAFIIFGHAVIVLTLFVAWASGTTESYFFPPHWLWGLGLHVHPGLGGWLPFAAAFTGLMTFLYVRACRAAAGLTVLWPFEAETIAALAEVTLESPEMTPGEIAKAVDQRWNAFPADRKNRLRSGFWLVALLPLLWGRAPLPWMDRKRRYEMVKNRLLPAGDSRSELGPLRTTVQASIRFVTQMIYMGYYNDPRSYGPTGYKRFSDRRRAPAAIAELAQRRETSGVNSTKPSPILKTISAPTVSDAHLTEDYVIVGSGAGGAIVASQLVNRGKNVLLLDRGEYVPPSEVTENEAEMYARLYSDGALQLSTDFCFQILQGMCVGGGTVVNNGICFDLPDEILQEWNEEFGAGIDRAELERSFAAVRAMIRVALPELDCVHFSPGVLATVAATNGHRIAAGRPWEPAETNMQDCLGCGNCNVGCRFGTKLSMIQKVLPDAQTSGKGRLRILPLCRVDRIEMNGARAARLRCVMRTARRQEVTIHADKAVVVAAGAVHSSRLLMDSGVGGGRVGRNLTANLASFMTGVFPSPQDAYDGLQITHHVPAAEPDGHVLETFFNPVMSQALIMPGWLEQHQRNMARYDQMMCVGALVRSHPEPENRVRTRPHALTGAEFDFRPSADDVKRLIKGLKAAGERLFDADADEVIPATYAYHVFKDRADLDHLDALVRDASDLGARTAHPQGGNGMSADPDLGVVDSDFRVHDTENLYVTDASVFPSAILVNPQLTIMALAHLAGSQKIA